MKLASCLLAATAFGLAATSAHAQDSGVYAGAGVDAFDFDAYTISGRLGYNFNDYFGVEGQAGFGIVDDEVSELGVDADVGVDYFAGAFGVLRAPVSPQFDVFARGGYYFSQFGVDGTDGVTNFDEDLDVDGFAIGAGGQFNFGLNMENSIRLEYTYLDADEGSVDGQDVELDGGADVFSLSYIRRF